MLRLFPRTAILLLAFSFLSCGKPSETPPDRPAVPDVKGATVKGAVLSDGKGLQNVVVSDGYEVTSTDENGFFWLKSKMKNGYVFVTLPSGFMPESSLQNASSSQSSRITFRFLSSE